MVRGGGSSELQSKAALGGGPPAPVSLGLILVGEPPCSLSLQTRWGSQGDSGFKELPITSPFKCWVLMGPLCQSAQCQSAWLEITPLELVKCGLKRIYFFNLRSCIPSAYTLLPCFVNWALWPLRVTSPRQPGLPPQQVLESTQQDDISGAKCPCSGCSRSSTRRNLYKGLPFTKHFA